MVEPSAYFQHSKMPEMARGFCLWTVCAILLCLSLFLPGTAYAQNTGDVQVNIMVPLSVRNDEAMDFGVLIPGDRNSRVRIDPNSGELEVVGGTAIPVGGTVSRATFTLTGISNERVRISITDNEILLTRSGGSDTMRLGQFRLDGGRNRFLDNEGNAQFAIGAQLRVNANQPRGVYRGSFSLTVDYF